MHPQKQQTPVDACRTEVEAVAAADRALLRGHDPVALLAVTPDALVNLNETGRKIQAQARQVSRGYTRSTVAGN